VHWQKPLVRADYSSKWKVTHWSNRDTECGGSITFGRALAVGGLMMLISCACYVAMWEVLMATVEKNFADPVWNQQAGPTVFSPFPEKTDYFGDATKQWMINFRVGDLDKMAGQLEAAGIAVKVDPATYPNGRFARIHDPEGTPKELWQPLNGVTLK
jgi:hypothetical protein